VLPGVLELLDALEGSRGVALGLGTGNIEAGARIKLTPARLSERFAFGGFGCDAEDRAELLEAGARRGAAALGAARARCRVVIIGDTPLDVAAAHAIGAECLAVATGNFDVDALQGAERVVERLDVSLTSWLAG
jgi:phosphoglycolate phosphatase-like HAD superfamily hydrolase